MRLASDLVALSAISAPAHVEVEMVAVCGVVVRAEYGAEALAGTIVNCGEKLHFLAPVCPVVFNRDPAPVGEHKGGYVYRIGVRMLRQFSRPGDIAATVTTHRLDALEVATKILACGAFNGIFGPGGEFAGKFAFHRPEIGDVRANIEQFDAVDLSASTTKLAIGQRRKADVGFTQVAETLPRSRGRVE